MTRLHACNITTARDLFSRTLLDLVELLDLPYGAPVAIGWAAGAAERPRGAEGQGGEEKDGRGCKPGWFGVGNVMHSEKVT